MCLAPSVNNSLVAIVSCLVSNSHGIRHVGAMYSSPCRILMRIVHCSIKVIVFSISLAVLPMSSADMHLSMPF